MSASREHTLRLLLGVTLLELNKARGVSEYTPARFSLHEVKRFSVNYPNTVPSVRTNGEEVELSTAPIRSDTKWRNI